MEDPLRVCHLQQFSDKALHPWVHRQTCPSCPQVVPLERSYLFCDISLCEESPANAVLRHFEFGWKIPRLTNISVFLYSTGIFDNCCILYDARGLYDKSLLQSVFPTGSWTRAIIENRTRILYRICRWRALSRSTRPDDLERACHWQIL